MSSINFSIGSYSTKKSVSDSDSNDSEIFQSSPAKRNREQEQSLVVGTTAEELKYRRSLFPFDDYSSLKKKGLACAACGCKIPVQVGEEVHSHMFLQVAVCKECKKFYGNGDISVDEDGTDKFCRLCGNGGDLFCCSTCTCVFCKRCVKRNIGRDAVKAIEKEDSWDCYICDIKPLWDLRAFLWGAKQYIDSIQRTKKQKVNATLLELSEKKQRPSARRTLARRNDSTTSDSEDETRKSNSDKENSSSDRSTKRPSSHKRPIRRLFTQPADEMLDISTQSSGRESRKQSKKGIVPSVKTPGVIQLPSDSDSETENVKANGNRKKSVKQANGKIDLTDADKSGEELKGKSRGDQPSLVENSSKKNNKRKRKKKKKDDLSSENGDSEESEEAVGNCTITSKFTNSRQASSSSSISAAMSTSDSDNSKLVLKKSTKATSKHSDQSDESNEESPPEIDKQTKKKSAFFESQAKEYNTGKRKKKKSGVSCPIDEEKEMDSVLTIESVETRHTSSGSDSVNSDSENYRSQRKVPTSKLSTSRVSKKAESSGDDEPKPQSSNEKTRKKRTKTKKHKKKEVMSDTEDESRNESHISANIDSESDHSIDSFGSQATQKRDTSSHLRVETKSLVENKSDDLERIGSINEASKKVRRSSCDIPDSPTKKSVNKRSASADDALGVNKALSDSPEKVLDTLENSNSDSEKLDSDEEMPPKVDKDSSKKIMAYMQQQCYVSNALGKSLCKVTKVIESKIKGQTDFQNTRNIDKMFNRMIRMSKSVKRNAKNLQAECLSKYKNWKKEARSGNGKLESASKSDFSIKKIQEDIAAWEEEFREWPEDDSSDDKPVKLKKSRDLCDTAQPSTSSKRSKERVSSTDFNNIHSEDVEEESQSLLAVANQDVEINECASVSSNVTQLYDYKKTSENLKSTEKVSSIDAGISDDMFSDSDADKSQTSRTKKPESSKKNGSKLSSKIAIDSDEPNGKAGEMDGECAQSLDTEDFPVATQLLATSRENSASPTADIVGTKLSDSESKVLEKRKSGPKSKSGRSLACPMSKKKKIKEPISAELIDDEESEHSRDSAPEDEVLSGKVSSSDRRSKSKDSKCNGDSQNGHSSSEELSPDKAKARLLATSSEDEPLKKLAEKSKKSSSSKSEGRRSSRGKRSLNYTANSSVKKNGSSSDTDDEGDFSDLGKSKKHSQVKNRPKKKLNMKSQSKLNRRLLRSFNDKRLVQTPVVELHRLQEEELLKYGITEIPMKKKNSSDSESDSTAVARLVNLKSAGKRNRQKRNSGSSSSADDLKHLKKKNKVPKESKKNKNAEVNQAHSSSEDDGKDAMDTSSTLVADNDLTEQELRDMNNRQLQEQLLASSSDDDAKEPVPGDEPKKKTPKKDSKEKGKDDEKASAKKPKKEKKGDDSDDKKDDSDDSDIVPKKKQAKRSKLFKMNLSMSDSSEEEAKFKEKEARRRAAKENAPGTPSNDESDEDAMLKPRSSQGKSPRGKKIKSDSDESVHIAESSSTNSDDDFVIPSKNKRKNKSSDSDSSDQKKKKTKRRRIKMPKSDSDSDVEEVDPSQTSTPGKGRKNIRKVMTEESVGEQTKRAAREELERKKRIEEKQLLYNQLYGTDGEKGKNLITERLVLDFDPETKEELVKVHDSIVRKLKPHQVRGVEFMWNVCYESVKQLEKNKGAGCILAHCMGLGKSFQVVALVHTLLVNPLTKVKTVLVVCPLSTALNWVNEFSIWLRDTKDDDEIDVFELSRYKKPIERMHKLQEWQRNGGVMVMNYELYRTLSMNNVKKLKKSIKESWARSLVDPGPDLVVCDEGHLLKNEDSAISKAMRKVKTLRRIVLTGTPLQNNLVEYHCMVNFVRPNLLGTRKEFLNRFVNPITNGQYENSTAHDVKIMKRRAHVLHKMLDGIVQRYDYAELTPFLPEKQEYVISVRLSEPQIKIYQHFLDNFSGLSLMQSGARNTRLLPDWHVFQRINTHPKVMLYHDEGAADKDAEQSDGSEGSLKDFIDDGEDTTSESSSGSGSRSGSEKKPSKPAPRRRLRGDPEPEEPEVVDATPAAGPSNEEWWGQYCTDDVINGINSSGKLAILFSLLRECEKIGDKVLVFSQSLFSLRLIEDFLERINNDTRRMERERKSKDGEPEPDPQLGGHSGTWVKGYDYFRLDGSISAENRSKDCKRFNNKKDHRSRLYLISTRAGGLGINLVAANRVVVFDASWNPSHDVQSIFRVFRFGQTKPCYIYRLLAYSTIEERVYERQVTKLSLSCRVVDEQQIDRHYSNKDIMAMYTFDHEPKADRPTPILPKDRMLAELLKEHAQWIETYHEHDSLLENKADEELNEEERKAAWEEYESLKKPQVSYDQQGAMFKTNPEALRTLLRSQNPDADEADIDMHMARIRQQVEVNEQRQAAALQQRMLQFQQQNYNYMQQQYQQQQNQQLLNAAAGIKYPMKYPSVTAAAYQQQVQYSGQQNPILNSIMGNQPLGKIPPQAPGNTGAGIPRISVRSVAEMQMPRAGGSKQPALNPYATGMRSAMVPTLPGMQRSMNVPPPLAHRTALPAVSFMPVQKDARPPQNSGAPLSPINLD